MKKVFVTLASAVLALGSLNAQDLAQITEVYNSGATALSGGNLESALEAFQQAYTLATALGADGQEVADNCKNVIPEVSLNLAKSLAQAEEYDAAIERLNSTVELAKEFDNDNVLAQAQTLIPQLRMQKGAKQLNSKDYAGAADTFKQILESDPTNGVAALRLGMALSATGDVEGAIEAYNTASENGQKATADKQLANLYLKTAVSELREKNYDAAIAAAVKVNEYGENSQAYQIAGQAAQLAGKNNEAIEYFVKYLELAPNAKNAGQIAYTVGALYQYAKNNEKAKEYYTMALDDPTYGAEAKKLLDALK